MKYIAAILISLTFSDLFSQHTSSDFKDGAGCGPFPLYVNVGYASAGFNDFTETQKNFNRTFEVDDRLKRRVNGVNLAIGTPIVWTTYPFILSPVVEAKYIVLAKSAKADAGRLDFLSNQFSIGGGLRYTFFPLVIQVQYQRVLLSKHDYRFKGPGERKIYSYGSKGDEAVLRLSLLDPAGSDGGVGFYFEYDWLFMRNDAGDHIREIIRTFDPGFEGRIRARQKYRFFSVGVIIPLALRLR